MIVQSPALYKRTARVAPRPHSACSQVNECMLLVGGLRARESISRSSDSLSGPIARRLDANILHRARGGIVNRCIEVMVHPCLIEDTRWISVEDGHGFCRWRLVTSRCRSCKNDARHEFSWGICTCRLPRSLFRSARTPQLLLMLESLFHRRAIGDTHLSWVFS